MDREHKERLEEAPIGMFPEDDDEYVLEGDLDVWGRGDSYTWNKPTTTWWTSGSISSYSGMWGGTTIHAGSSNSDAIRLQRHQSHLDSLCTVVDPTVKHTLSFGKTDTGYTNMETGHIVIDGSLLKESDTNLDMTCGLAIHEKLHVVHSKPLHRWMKEMMANPKVKYGERELLHSICNIVEDEYIERQLSISCPGYVHFLEKVKDHYFGGDSKATEDSGHEFTDIINTLLLLVRYPSNISDARKKAHSPHIRYFMSELKDGLNDRESTYNCITNIWMYLKNVWEDIGDDSPDEEKMHDEATKAADSYMDKIKADYKDMGITLPPESKLDKMHESVYEDEFSRLMRDHSYDAEHAMAKALRKSETDKADYASLAKGLSGRMLKAINDLAESDYHEIKIDRSIAISAKQRKISWVKAKQTDLSVRTYKEDTDAVRTEINKLKRKIDLYGNTTQLTIRNQKRGMLDKRMLHRIPTGRMDLFKATITNEDKPLDVCLLVDESGSMGHYTMTKARQAAIAIKEALSDNSMLNLWVFGHTADEHERGMTEMYEYSSPTMQDRPMAMGGMRAKYENRDGNAIIASTMKVKSESSTPHAQKLLIMLSDGEPSADKYRGDISYSHTAKCVKYAESRGWNVIQVGFAGARKYSMDKMFTNWVYIDDTDKLGDEVSKIIRKVIKV